SKLHLGEVYFYFCCQSQGWKMTLAIISQYSEPAPDLLVASHGTFALCQYFADDALLVIDVSCIESVVAMVHYNHAPHSIVSGNHFFLVEQPGLDIWKLRSTQADFIPEM
ncbi:hypothetical protein CPB84DRAFT_1691755, partial [Gymnopilus junonius]